MRIAVTGGVAEGKSTLVAALAKRGLRTVSADAVARAVRDDPATHRALAEAFSLPLGNLEDGLRLMLADPAERRKLNRIMHPLVWRAMQATPHDVAEIPLLVETCLYDTYDYVVVVTCGEDEQLRRLVARVGDKTTAERLLRSQLPTRAKKPFADLIVRTDGTLEDVHHAAGRIDAVFRGMP